mmetsp:Transcript_24119/g.91016  ORF Transcript_24119/g.91016 Transcript_24119/m.91016 type:complete len:246 (-) Transcript_24119:36-773(-)
MGRESARRLHEEVVREEERASHVAANGVSAKVLAGHLERGPHVHQPGNSWLHAHGRVKRHGHHVLRGREPVVAALGRERVHVGRRRVLARAALDLGARIGRAAPAGVQNLNVVVAVHAHHPPKAGRKEAAHVIVGNDLGVLPDAELRSARLDLGFRGDGVGPGLLERRGHREAPSTRQVGALVGRRPAAVDNHGTRLRELVQPREPPPKRLRAGRGSALRESGESPAQHRRLGGVRVARSLRLAA